MPCMMLAGHTDEIAIGIVKGMPMIQAVEGIEGNVLMCPENPLVQAVEEASMGVVTGEGGPFGAVITQIDKTTGEETVMSRVMSVPS